MRIRACTSSIRFPWWRDDDERSMGILISERGRVSVHYCLESPSSTILGPDNFVG